MKRINFVMLLSILTSLSGYIVLCTRDRTFYNPLDSFLLLPFVFIFIGFFSASEFLLNKFFDYKKWVSYQKQKRPILE